MKTRILTIDVESIGLHGPSFAIGWVLTDFYGQRQDENILATRPDSIRTDDLDALFWVSNNVKVDYSLNYTPLYIRTHFWNFWEKIRKDTILAADVPWPVEANFLSMCIADEPIGRNWAGPYPIFDIASFLFGRNKQGMQMYDRLPDELPKHNPLADARQSSRLLHEHLTNSILNLLEGL